MITAYLLGLVLLIVSALVYLLLLSKPNDPKELLINLSDQQLTSQNPINWQTTKATIANLSDRLGRAGFITAQERGKALMIIVLIVLSSLAIGLFFGIKKENIFFQLVGLFSGTYFAILFTLFFLRLREQRFDQEISFHLPILLENIILLVESGYGILPALEHATCLNIRSNSTKHLFNLVYKLSAFGLPFAKALEIIADAVEIKILRHVLIHLDLSNSEGGELVSSLRSLSEHAHQEWKLNVENRVKRLENLVVFPVFAAVLGLILLISSVPLIPVLKLRDSLHNQNQIAADLNSTEINQIKKN